MSERAAGSEGSADSGKPAGSCGSAEFNGSADSAFPGDPAGSASSSGHAGSACSVAGRYLLPVVFWLAVWQAVSCYVNQPLLFPSPLETARTFASIAGSEAFVRCTMASLARIFSGLLAGIMLGTGLAFLTCFIKPAEYILAPMLRLIRAVPVASFIILILLWVHKDLVPCVISALIVMPVIWENVSSGIASVDPLLLEMSRAYGFSRIYRLRYIYMPDLNPALRSGILNAIGLAWKSGVAAEVLCLPGSSVGTQVYYSKLYLDTPALFAWTLTVIALSLVFEKAVRLILKNR